ncbi:hypothetical protein HZB58_05070 [Candidatus Gottesmanbacteria bacterium]|nr:hypothetical protein [Candidatus Gottesmanbacteria bacterium]
MNDQTTPDEVQDAEVVETSPESVSPGADTVLELENMIKNTMTVIDRNKNELKKLKEMLESALLNDSTYKEMADKAKEANKEKGKAKMNVMQNSATKQIAEKVKDMTQENKDLAVAQSEYLREYAKLSGTNEIEGEDGEVREIIYVAKLVKKSRRNS